MIAILRFAFMQWRKVSIYVFFLTLPVHLFCAFSGDKRVLVLQTDNQMLALYPCVRDAECRNQDHPKPGVGVLRAGGSICWPSRGA
jgi:hypothetical protein